jgi:branched-chain amino acid transport system substrate-binding protein
VKGYELQAGYGTKGIVMALVGIVAVIAVFFVLESKTAETIKIAAILSLSGPGSDMVDLRDSMIMAVDEINSWGGVNGNKIELMVGDSKTNPEEAKKVFKKIEAAHHPLLYVSTHSSVGMALAPLAAENKVVLVGLVATAPRLTAQNEWIFRFFPTAEVEVRPILSILHRLKVKKLGILYLNDEFGSSVCRVIREGFEKADGTVKIDAFDPEEVDYKKHITKLKDMEAIYMVGFATHLKNGFR